MRAVIYARYSSSLQNDSSIENQIVACQKFVKEKGWSLVTTYADHAISGRTISQRPEFSQLLRDSEDKAFDIVIALHSDRLSRDTADMTAIYRDFRFNGIEIWTVNEGALNDNFIVSIRGAMNEQYSVELGKKTKLGQRGRVSKGKKAGGKAFGYRVVAPRWIGKILERGDREIIPDEAAIVLRIFQEYASGISPREISNRLNREGIPGPEGREWIDTTIRGQITRGTGILNNHNYVGINVWDKCSYVTNPKTGKKVARPNPESEWVKVPKEEWRIISKELWQAVKERQKRNATTMPRKGGVALNRLHRKKHLLSGFVRCGTCGGPMAINNGPAYSCSNRRRKGTCESTITIKREKLESRVLHGIKAELLRQDYIDLFVAEVQREIERCKGKAEPALISLEKQLNNTNKEIANLISVIKSGSVSPAISRELSKLEDRLQTIEEQKCQFEQTAKSKLEVSSVTVDVYRNVVDKLHHGLVDGISKCQAFEVLQSMIDNVVVGVAGDPDRILLTGDAMVLIEYYAEISGETASLEAGMALSMPSVVAGVGFEPTTFRL